MKMNLRSGFGCEWNGATMPVVCAVMIALTATGVAQAAENYEVIVERNVAAKMRDGVTLRADIYRPKAEGKFPVLLVRTPYDKTNESSFGMKGAARGYVVVEQDVRGRFTSEGRVVHIQERIAGRVRHGGVGCGAALFERKSGNVWRVVRGRDAVFGGNCEAAPFRGDLPDGDGLELSRRVDVSGRSV